ncbi:hypothetical protein ICY_04474 [Bacillus cereus BAG2X1-3]|nr:hypothetical protein ICU_04585 [Bacillus cereus BAG2X1-1]EJS70355.1 hypothetical protein ICY_04474 [Bacillus cereus BAG2X1-3]
MIFIFLSFEILHRMGMIEIEIYGKETRTQYVDELVKIRNEIDEFFSHE